MHAIARLTAGTDGDVVPEDYERTIEALLLAGSGPVITAGPEGAWTHMVADEALR